MVNNIARDNAFVTAKKNVRKRGKIAKFIQNGESVNRISQGDSVRGELHEATFLGKNKVITSDKNGNPEYVYVKRVGFNIENFSKKEDIEEKVYEPSLVLKLIAQEENKGKSFKDIMNDGLWHKDKNGKLTKIRHIRKKTDDKYPLEIKKQTYTSQSKENREHKQFYYAVNAENYCFAFYQGEVNGKIERTFKLYNLFDMRPKIPKEDVSQVENGIPLYTVLKTGQRVPLYTVLKTGQRVLFYKSNVEELRTLDNTELSKRLYRIYGFKKDKGSARIKLQHHLFANVPNENDTWNPKTDDIFNEKGVMLLILTKKNWNFAIEDEDFNIEPDGTIRFLLENR